MAWRKTAWPRPDTVGRPSGMARGTLQRIEATEKGVSFESVSAYFGGLGCRTCRRRWTRSSDIGRIRSGQQLPQRVRPTARRARKTDLEHNHDSTPPIVDVVVEISGEGTYRRTALGDSAMVAAAQRRSLIYRYTAPRSQLRARPLLVERTGQQQTAEGQTLFGVLPMRSRRLRGRRLHPPQRDPPCRETRRPGEEYFRIDYLLGYATSYARVRWFRTPVRDLSSRDDHAATPISLTCGAFWPPPSSLNVTGEPTKISATYRGGTPLGVTRPRPTCSTPRAAEHCQVPAPENGQIGTSFAGRPRHSLWRVPPDSGYPSSPP